MKTRESKQVVTQAIAQAALKPSSSQVMTTSLMDQIMIGQKWALISMRADVKSM